MPIEIVPGTSLKYSLLAFDAFRNECNEPDGRKLSDRLLTVLKNEPFTDIFLISHGWLGDIPDARNQYNRHLFQLLRIWSTGRENLGNPPYRDFVSGFHKARYWSKFTSSYE